MAKRIGIELNHVVRNINHQLLKYYCKAMHNMQDFDIDEVDENSDVLNERIKFPTKKEKSDFIYIDYPYEIFGCAGAMDRNLPRDLNSWLVDISDIEDEDYEICFYSLYEDNLSIQSTYFFLSKIGSRVRTMYFPHSEKEAVDKFDYIITANKDVVTEAKAQGKKCIMIEKPWNQERKDDAFAVYDGLESVINDKEFFNKLKDEYGKEQQQ